MKIQYFVMSALVMFAAGSAHAGPGSTGGGDGIGSPEELVVQTLEDSKLELGVFIHSASLYADSALNPANVNHARVKAVLQSWLKKERGLEALISDIDHSTYNIQPQACPSQIDHHHDASTLFHRDAPICFSTKLLSRFPKWVLQAELLSLAAHEHAHHFGYSEDDATAVQNYIFATYGFLTIQEKLRSFYNSDLQNYRSRINTGYSPAGSPAAVAFAEMICRDYFVIEGLAIAYGLNQFQYDARQRLACDATKFNPDALESKLNLIEAYTVSDFNK